MKKLLTVLLAAVMLFTAIPVMAFAESIEDTAVAIESGAKQKATLKNASECADYKVKLTKDGELKVTLTAKISNMKFFVMDTDGNTIEANSTEFKSGESDWYYGMEWNKTFEKLSVVFTYELNKGTYYLRAMRGRFDAKGSGEMTLTAKFPGEEKEEAAKITVLGITMKKGDTMQLTADLTAKDGKVTWKSSKKSVATVSKDGVVTAVKKGTTTITAKCGKSSVKLKITVK